jgi:hypothetical protein
MITDDGYDKDYQEIPHIMKYATGYLETLYVSSCDFSRSTQESHGWRHIADALSQAPQRYKKRWGFGQTEETGIWETIPISPLRTLILVTRNDSYLQYMCECGMCQGSDYSFRHFNWNLDGENLEHLFKAIQSEHCQLEHLTIEEIDFDRLGNDEIEKFLNTTVRSAILHSKLKTLKITPIMYNVRDGFEDHYDPEDIIAGFFKEKAEMRHNKRQKVTAPSWGCPICYELFDGKEVKPLVSQICGHVVCETCHTKARSENCTICRKNVNSIPLYLSEI